MTPDTTELKDIIINDGLEAGRKFLNSINLKEVCPYGILEDYLDDDYSYLEEVLTLICEFYGSDSIEFPDEYELAYHLMQYPGQSFDLICACTELGIKFNHLDYFRLSATHNYDEHFNYLIQHFKFSNKDYNNFFKTLLGFGEHYLCEFNDIDKQYKEYEHISTMIKRLIMEFNVNVNTNDAGGQFNYAVLNCLYFYPNALQYFFTEHFDGSILEENDFWTTFCSTYIEKNIIKHYIIAFQQIKASGITFDDSIMLSALKSAGLDELINAYVNEPNGKS
ncbi:hypothetical protein ACU5DF_00695 [Aliivibrio wodanis]|uniref:hypothetical protein n=1 Tax=Aliivibrio wodanis TaxID=80852 RepID=UPI00406D20E7